MGIALPDPDSAGRSKLASAAFTAIGLVFFFGVGLAGGAAYKIYFSEDGGPQATAQASPSPAAPAAPPEQISAAATPAPAESAAEKAAPDLAQNASAAPTERASPAAAAAADQAQPAPESAEAAGPPIVAQAPAAADAGLQAASAQPPAIPESETATAAPETQAATQTAAPAPAAIAPKTALAAKPHRGAPPAAPGTLAGHFHVQFGAFANEENARRVQSAVATAGLKVAVSHEAGASGNPLFIVRSPSYPDRAAAVSAAQNVQSRAKHLANPVALDYAIIPDRAAPEQHAQR